MNGPLLLGNVVVEHLEAIFQWNEEWHGLDNKLLITLAAVEQSQDTRGYPTILEKGAATAIMKLESFHRWSGITYSRS